MKYVSILGSTGSIGKQALNVISANPDKFQVVALTANKNDELLEQQIEQFRPLIAVLADSSAGERLARRYKGFTKILKGEEGILEAATIPQADVVLTSMVGFAGLKPTLAAIDAGKDIALANKETLVAAGELVNQRAREKKVRILPVDSEHSAILQCLRGEDHRNIRKIILTASGGPFRGFSAEQLKKVTISDCLKHPNWDMGNKITIDSATLANKGLEVIEAKWLFNVEYEQIEVVVHPQSIIHSMVEFVDGAIMAQLGKPDMRIPIQYALTYPDRIESSLDRLDFRTLSSLTFETPDVNTFPSLKMAFMAGRAGGTLPCVFSAANEEAVYAFLKGRIQFHNISEIVKFAIERHKLINNPNLHQIFAADEWARSLVSEAILGLQ